MEINFSDSEIAQSLLLYSELGFFVHPMHGIIDGQCTCGNSHSDKPKGIGKHPFSLHGFKDAVQAGAAKEVAALFSQNPSLNIAVATGEKSGVFVIDVDGEIGSKTINELQAKHSQLPDTLTTITGNGYHMYFRHPGFIIQTKTDALGKGVDIKGDGGSCHLPPSKHMNGAQYNFIDETRQIAECPEWVFNIINKPKPELSLAPISDVCTPLRAWSIDDVRSMLSYLNPSMGYSDWINVGMGLHEGGYEHKLWQDWSAISPKYSTGITSTHWRNFKCNGGITMGTVVNMAKLAGWHAQKTLNSPSLLKKTFADIPFDTTSEGSVEVMPTSPILCAKKTLQSLTLTEFLNLKIPPREMVLSPIIPTQGLVMLYAARGIGKTHVSLSIALTVASGSETLRWKADKPRKVLFVDGEMPAIVLQERLALLVKSNGTMLPEPEYLKIITPDQQDFGISDLTTPHGQEAIEQHLFGVDLLILDNLSSLCRNGKENEAESWMPIQGWILDLRRRGISVLLIHHAGKSGAQRGTSKREDLLDTVITLKRPSDYVSSQGARFEVHYEKSRGFYGEDAKPFEAILECTEFSQQWLVNDLEENLVNRIQKLKADNHTQRAIAKAVGCSAATVNRALKNNQNA